MIIGVRLYMFKNGEMKLFSNTEKVYDIYSMNKPIRKWYRKNKYAKRINKNWICQDYRIDQQRPYRNVYSQAYLKIFSMTEIEERVIDRLIDDIEKEIEYPTVWGNGEDRFYEETIICPKCNKQRKPFTSKEICEYCGFDFRKTLKCPKCNMLSLKGSEKCSKCGYVFRKKSFINNDEFKVEKNKYMKKEFCSECGEIKSKYYDKCLNCGFDFKGKKQCFNCGKWVRNEDKYCMNCGERLRIIIQCECGKQNDGNNLFCTKCGKKLE